MAINNLPPNPPNAGCVYDLHSDLNQIYRLMQDLPNNAFPPSATNVLTGNSAVSYANAVTLAIAAAGTNPLQTITVQQLNDNSYQYLITLNIA